MIKCVTVEQAIVKRSPAQAAVTTGVVEQLEASELVKDRSRLGGDTRFLVVFQVTPPHRKGRPRQACHHDVVNLVAFGVMVGVNGVISWDTYCRILLDEQHVLSLYRPY